MTAATVSAVAFDFALRDVRGSGVTRREALASCILGLTIFGLIVMASIWR